VQTLPWLDYSGQTASALVACRASHRIDSILCAFEEGIRNKVDQKGSITGEERLVLAVMALQREVNDGGLRQFFVNYSRDFAPIIQSSLLRIQCRATAEIVTDAIAALGLTDISVETVAEALQGDDPARDQALRECDDRFYQINEIESNLFSFVEAHQDKIELAGASPAPRQTRSSTFLNISKLYAGLIQAHQTDYTLEWTRSVAEDLARKQAIPATASELDGAAVLYSLDQALKAGDLDACEKLALLAFDLVREHTMQGVLHKDWIQQLIASSQEELADAATLAYLEFLKNSDPTVRATHNRIKLWATTLQEHAGALPNSVKFYNENFTGLGLDRIVESVEPEPAVSVEEPRATLAGLTRGRPPHPGSGHTKRERRKRART
jgi:hypothetical protein